MTETAGDIGGRWRGGDERGGGGWSNGLERRCAERVGSSVEMTPLGARVEGQGKSGEEERDEENARERIGYHLDDVSTRETNEGLTE